jgi:predicted nucleotidyltransferase
VTRATIEVRSVPGGWPRPWPDVAELAAVLPSEKWTLVGGLMTQLHVVHHGLGVVRPTNDVDIVLHVETTRGVAAAAAAALESAGYRLLDSVDPRQNTAHRFVRDDSTVDLVGGRVTPAATVDVLRADHAAPAVVETLRGREMVAIDGGTQALRRTVNARVELAPGVVTTISVPRPFAAVVLKAAAYVADARDPDRHLHDAAALLACIEDPFAERGEFGGSDRGRLLRLEQALPPETFGVASSTARSAGEGPGGAPNPGRLTPHAGGGQPGAGHAPPGTIWRRCARQNG